MRRVQTPGAQAHGFPLRETPVLRKPFAFSPLRELSHYLLSDVLHELQEFGVALTEVGQTERAVAVFEQLLERDPGNTAATEWLSRLRPNEAAESAPPDGP